MTRARWRETTRSVPVLMYHAFSVDGERERYLATKSLLRRCRCGCWRSCDTGSSLSRSSREGLREGRMPARRTAVVTIDDGYARQPRDRPADPAAAPLPGHPLPGQPPPRRQQRLDHAGHAIAGRPLASAEQVECRCAGSALDDRRPHPHPLRPPLRAPSSVAREEVVGWREDLEALLGAPVTTFAYPYGEFDDRDVVDRRRRRLSRRLHGRAPTRPTRRRPPARSRASRSAAPTARDASSRKLWHGGL